MSVYFARVGDYVKIGFSDDPVGRSTSVTRLGLRPARIEHGAEVDFIGWIPGDLSREAELHARFAAKRTTGEWFILDRPTVEAIIWDDPSGVDIKRMSMMAVLACLKYPEMTRDELEAAGITILGRSIEEILADPDSILNKALGGAA